MDASIFDTESVVISRKAATATGGAFPVTQIYSGACDFQSNAGSTFYNPAGVVDVADAVLMISPDSGGNFPVVLAGDKAAVTQNGQTTDFNIVNTAAYTFPIETAHLELLLKRGPLSYKGRT